MASEAEQAAELYRDAGRAFDDGLTETELDAVEGRWGFQFAPDHREFLSLLLPTENERWPDWRRESDESLATRLARPVEWILSDVESGWFWPRLWGPAPGDPANRKKLAESKLASVAPLVPLVGNNYVPGIPDLKNAPILSVWGADVTISGYTLADWAHAAFVGYRPPDVEELAWHEEYSDAIREGREPPEPLPSMTDHRRQGWAPFWSNLANWDEDYMPSDDDD